MPLAAWPPAAQGRRVGERDMPSSRTGGSSGMSLAAWPRAAQARCVPQHGGPTFKPQRRLSGRPILAAELREAAAASVALPPRLNPRLGREDSGDKALRTSRGLY